MTSLLLFQSASQVCPGRFAAGFADGSVRIYDVRSPDRLVQYLHLWPAFDA